MIEFKVGDYIRYVYHLTGNDERIFKEGFIYKITSIIGDDDDPEIYLDGHSAWVCVCQIALVEKDILEKREESISKKYEYIKTFKEYVTFEVNGQRIEMEISEAKKLGQELIGAI